MTHFAEIVDGKVVRVIVAEQDFINSGKVGVPTNWIQTSYNTKQGIHKLGGTPLRKNYAGIGYNYDSVRDAFIPPKQHPSFVLNKTKGIYEPPTPLPNDGKRHKWNELNKNWDLIGDI